MISAHCVWKYWCSYSRICGTVAFHSIFFVGPSKVSDLRFFFISTMSMSVNFKDLGEIFHLSAFCLWYKFKCSANNWMRSSLVTVLTAYVWTVNYIYIYIWVPYILFCVWGFVAFTPSINYYCSLISLSLLSVFEGSCQHAAQKQLLLWLLCSAWYINRDFYFFYLYLFIYCNWVVTWWQWLFYM